MKLKSCDDWTPLRRRTYNDTNLNNYGSHDYGNDKLSTEMAKISDLKTLHKIDLSTIKRASQLP